MQASAPSPIETDRPARDANVVDEWLADGSMVLFHTTTRQLVTLNATGALVWEHCDGTCSVDEIASQLQSVFPDAPDLRSDVDAVVRDLRARGMIGPDRSNNQSWTDLSP